MHNYMHKFTCIYFSRYHAQKTYANWKNELRMHLTAQTRVSLFLAHIYNTIYNVMYVSKTKQLVICKTTSVFYLGFARKMVLTF